MSEYIVEQNSIKYITHEFLALTDVDQMISILQENDIDPNIKIYNNNFIISLHFWAIYHQITPLSTYLYNKLKSINLNINNQIQQNNEQSHEQSHEQNTEQSHEQNTQQNNTQNTSICQHCKTNLNEKNDVKINIDNPCIKFNNWYMYIFFTIYSLFCVVYSCIMFCLYLMKISRGPYICYHNNCVFKDGVFTVLINDPLTQLYNYIVMSSIPSSNILKN